MAVRNKHTGNIRTTVSHERRVFLKAGVAMAAAPFIAGMASTVLPSKAQAAKNNTPCKKILIISASPRENSNSDALCDEFMRGAQASGHHVEKIRLSEKDINYCTGCLACIHDPGSCVQQDDMAEIHKKNARCRRHGPGYPGLFSRHERPDEGLHRQGLPHLQHDSRQRRLFCCFLRRWGLPSGKRH